MKTLFGEEGISVRLTCGPADGKVITMDRWKPFLEIAVRQNPLVTFAQAITFTRSNSIATYRIRQESDGKYVGFYIG